MNHYTYHHDVSGKEGVSRKTALYAAAYRGAVKIIYRNTVVAWVHDFIKLDKSIEQAFAEAEHSAAMTYESKL